MVDLFASWGGGWVGAVLGTIMIIIIIIIIVIVVTVIMYSWSLCITRRWVGGSSLRNRTQCLAIVTQRGELYLPSDDDDDDNDDEPFWP